MKMLLAGICMCMALIACAEANQSERLSEFLIGMTSGDISDNEEFVPSTLENDCSAFLLESDITASQLVSSVAQLVRDMAVDSAIRTNYYKGRVFSCGLSFLGDYGSRESYDDLAYVITNCVSGGPVDLASYYYCRKNIEENCALGVYDTPRFWALSRTQRDAAVNGLCWAFDARSSSSTVTNRVLALGMKLLPAGESFGHFDSRLTSWWPAYATSSNRYVSAQRALQADPPCASSNYLARVIAELEALPPGTMQMLSTNHLGQAWGE